MGNVQTATVAGRVLDVKQQSGEGANAHRDLCLQIYHFVNIMRFISALLPISTVCGLFVFATVRAGAYALVFRVVETASGNSYVLKRMRVNKDNDNVLVCVRYGLPRRRFG